MSRDADLIAQKKQGFLWMVGDTARIAWRYLSGDQEGAERLEHPAGSEVAWVRASETDPERSAYAVELAIRSATAAQDAVASIQSKASSLVGLTATLFVLALGVTGLAMDSLQDGGRAAWVATAAFVGADLLLLLALVRSFYASGSVLSGGVNLDRLGSSADSTGRLQVTEAEAWLYASQLAGVTSQSRSWDLFFTRRCLVLALVTVLIGTPFIVAARNSVAIAENKKASGITGSLRYLGGPPPGHPRGNEPGVLVAYSADGAEAGSASWQEGQGFFVALDAGTYRIVASSGDAHCPEQTVTVVSGQFVNLRINCDVV
jgi:hypothetical protein